MTPTNRTDRPEHDLENGRHVGQCPECTAIIRRRFEPVSAWAKRAAAKGLPAKVLV